MNSTVEQLIAFLRLHDGINDKAILAKPAAQQLVDEPEAEPFAVIHLDGSFVHVEFKQTIAGTGKFEVYTAPPPQMLSDERILHHLDAILKASGSGLKNYSMHKTIEEMKQAFRAVEREILGGGE